jgi:hypothetical protein
LIFLPLLLAASIWFDYLHYPAGLVFDGAAALVYAVALVALISVWLKSKKNSK